MDYKIINIIINNRTVFDGVDEVYIFGSALKCNNPSDLDLLIVYSKKRSNILEELTKIKSKLAVLTKMSIDITAMNETELKNSDFLKAINCYKKIK